LRQAFSARARFCARVSDFFFVPVLPLPGAVPVGPVVVIVSGEPPAAGGAVAIAVVDDVQAGSVFASVGNRVLLRATGATTNTRGGNRTRRTPRGSAF
jgi:hypothetical protein